MSAIAGIHFSDARPVNYSDLSRMLATMHHRGPDKASVWCSGPIGLGHRLLWTTPESRHERLSAGNTSSELAITADARIDNRDELLASLQIVHDSARETPDSKLILWAYERWGERCPERLLGDFVFAIWDGPKQTLFCARDHFGVKPFYYYRSNQGFFFASEIKALLCLAEVPRLLNDARVADFLAPNLQDTSTTFYQDILRLPPAHSLSVRTSGVFLQRYWSLDPAREIHCRSNMEYAQGFREIFTDAVRVRLRCSFPVGSLLSGGLDSSSIVCVARQLLAETSDSRLHTFSAVFPDTPESDESSFIQTVLNQGGLEPHRVSASDISPLRDLEGMLNYEDEPFYAPNLFLHWALYIAAKAQDVRVLLDGIDGDTTVSHGIAYLHELARKGRWIALAREIRGLSRNFQRSPWRILKFHALRPFVPEVVWRARNVLRGGPPSAPNIPPLLNRDFACRIGWSRTQTPKRGWEAQSAPSGRQDHYRGLTQGLIPYALEVADHAAMAFSIEPRYPFLDKRLAEYCLALPPEQKLYRGWTRMVMRRAMAGILPPEVQWRGGKADLSRNFFRRLCSEEAHLLEDLVQDSAPAIRDYVDQQTLRQAHRRYVASGDRDDALTLWQAVTLESWLRRWSSRPQGCPPWETEQHFEHQPNGPQPLAGVSRSLVN